MGDDVEIVSIYRKRSPGEVDTSKVSYSAGVTIGRSGDYRFPKNNRHDVKI